MSSCIGRRCLVVAAPWRPRQRLRGQTVHADAPESRGDYQQLGSWLNRARHRPRCVVLLLIFVRVLPLLDKTEDAPCRGTMFGCFCVPSLCRRSYVCITSTYAHDDVIDDGRTKSVCSLLRVSATLTFLATSDNEVNNYDERICMRDVQERVRRAIRVRTMPILMCVDVCVEVLAVRVCAVVVDRFFFFHIANVHHSMYSRTVFAREEGRPRSRSSRSRWSSRS